MKILLSAGIHDNPIHRWRLKDLFSHLVEKHCRPWFIAVEANRALFHAVIIQQRDTFISIAKKDKSFDALDKKVLQELSMAIGYEADSHLETFAQEVQTVWLDDIRKDFSTACDPCGTARRCLYWYKKAVEDNNLEISNTTSAKDLFEAIDNYMTRSVNQQRPSGPVSVPSFDRDHAWMNMLKDMTSGEADATAIIVVGAEHAQNKPFYLRYLLGEAGHDCEVRYLSEAP